MIPWFRVIHAFPRGLTLLALVGILAAGPPAAARAAVGGDSSVIRRLPTDRHAELEAYAIAIMNEESVPGMAYAIVENDQVVYAKGFGVKEQHGIDPVNPYTTFMIGSTSKAFTTALAAMLADEGKLHWNDRVIQHLPGFQLMDPWVTREFIVEDLFSQRSGLPAYSLDPMSFIGFSGRDIQRALRFVEPVSSARRMTYVNNLFLTGADLIEQVSGFNWADNLDRRIFEPLGMASSTTDPGVAGRTGNWRGTRPPCRRHALDVPWTGPTAAGCRPMPRRAGSTRTCWT